jgi:hypothetical protein
MAESSAQPCLGEAMSLATLHDECSALAEALCAAEDMAAQSDAAKTQAEAAKAKAESALEKEKELATRRMRARMKEMKEALDRLQKENKDLKLANAAKIAAATQLPTGWGAARASGAATPAAATAAAAVAAASLPACALDSCGPRAVPYFGAPMHPKPTVAGRFRLSPPQTHLTAVMEYQQDSNTNTSRFVRPVPTVLSDQRCVLLLQSFLLCGRVCCCSIGCWTILRLQPAYDPTHGLQTTHLRRTIPLTLSTRS